MKTINVASDVYDYLLEQVATADRSISDLLREKLGISATPKSSPRPSAEPKSELDQLFNSTEFRYAKGVVGRFLVLLAWLYRKHKADFDKVETIKGRGRLYFAKSARALHEAGRSVNPKQIPGSPFWVITTSPTDLKQQMIRAVMFAFGYRTNDISRAESAIAGVSERQRVLDTL
jgi:negative modulator of initiation of replication